MYFFALELALFRALTLNFYRISTTFHNLKAETSTFRIQVSPSLSDPESGFSLYLQVAYSHSLPARNPPSAKS